MISLTHSQAACMLRQPSRNSSSDDLPERHDVRYVGGIYDIREGTVEFFEDLHETE